MLLRLISATLAGVLALAASSASTQAGEKPGSHKAMIIIAPANYTEHSYRGTPDLGLTLAIVQAGGGAADFDSRFLFRTLAGKHAGAESAKLKRLYGRQKFDAFMRTFNFAMRDIVKLFALNDIALPHQPRVAPTNGRAMTVAIYRDGVMPTGKYDCGYMMEHLMTHPIHIVLMHDIDVAPGHGPVNNANFHIILTRMIADLRDMYTDNGKTS
jgi:hypothetical protein